MRGGGMCNENLVGFLGREFVASGAPPILLLIRYIQIPIQIQIRTFYNNLTIALIKQNIHSLI